MAMARPSSKITRQATELYKLSLARCIAIHFELVSESAKVLLPFRTKI
jgi:hypothetical protein